MLSLNSPVVVNTSVTGWGRFNATAVLRDESERDCAAGRASACKLTADRGEVMRYERAEAHASRQRLCRGPETHDTPIDAAATATVPRNEAWLQRIGR